MSELINVSYSHRKQLGHLLTGVSALALAVAVTTTQSHAGEDVDHPTVWIDLGGQLEQMDNGRQAFSPPFVANMPDFLFSPTAVQKPLHSSYGGEGAISLEPSGSDWVLSASIRFGRSNGQRQRHQETPNAHVPVSFTFYGNDLNRTKYPSSHVRFSDANVQQRQSHTVLDFQAGRDLGIGLFGRGGTSVLSAGVRFAQFSSSASVDLHAQPDVQYPSTPIHSIAAFVQFHSGDIFHFHDYAAIETESRSFHGIGPSVAWKASTPFVGSPEVGELTFDWGVNAAVLFGRRKASGHHQTTVHTYVKQGFENGAKTFVSAFGTVSETQHATGAAFSRSQSVIVPNLGGFAGVSYLFPNARLSIGYRADFFFDAMDGGIDTHTSETRGLFGPFATISVGLGG